LGERGKLRTKGEFDDSLPNSASLKKAGAQRREIVEGKALSVWADVT
jgi:hypothetical protein